MCAIGFEIRGISRKVCHLGYLISRGNFQQAWFPGGHGGVGGGEKAAAPLSDCALEWMFNKLNESGSGLHFDADRIQTPICPNPHHNVVKRKISTIDFITNLLGKKRRANLCILI